MNPVSVASPRAKRTLPEAGAGAGGVVEHVPVAVEAGHLAVRTDPIRQQRQDPDRAAADVDDVAADGDVEAIEQRPGLVLQERRLGHQPGPFVRGVAEHVLRSVLSPSPCDHSTRRRVGESWRSPDDPLEHALRVGVSEGLLVACPTAARPVRLEA